MTKQAKSKELASVKSTELALVDTDLISMVAEDSGMGLQNLSSNDMQTPILRLLQANSPICKKSDPAYVQGATEGDFYNNVTGKVYSGEEGINVIPCHFEKVYIEWKAGRNGLAGIHPSDTPKLAELRTVKNQEGREVQVLPNGNEFVETNQHYILILNEDGTFEPAVLGMSSSALSASRRWNTLMKQVILKKDGRSFIAPSFYTVYKVQSKTSVKDKYSWASFNISPVGPVSSVDVYNAAKNFHRSIAEGRVKVKHEVPDEAPASSVNVSDLDG